MVSNIEGKCVLWILPQLVDCMCRMADTTKQCLQHAAHRNQVNIFINPLGPRILLKHALMFPGFLAIFERFYLYVLKRSVEKNLFNIVNYKLCLF